MDLWTLFCGQYDCARTSSNSKTCHPQFGHITLPSSCINHASIICFDLLLFFTMLIYNFLGKIILRKPELPANRKQFMTLQILSAVFNGCLGLVYITFGISNLKKNLTNNHSIAPIHWWILFFFHGVTWLFLGLTTLRKQFFSEIQFQFLSVFAFMYSGIFSFLALYVATVNHQTTVKVVLDILSFLGASCIVLFAYKGPTNVEKNDSKEIASARVTPFSEAGLFSKLSFCWLNPLMKLGRKRTLEEDDLPKLRELDRAGYCYTQFLNQLKNPNSDTDTESWSESSILWAIVACNKTEILLTGFFALLKVLTKSTGPVFLFLFMKVAEGKESFRHEGYILAISLFVTKILESLSQRQWYFRTRLMGLKVRSTLKAVIFRKQQRLSTVGKRIHTGGKILNYVTGDSQSVGEFLFWFHRIWTTVVQICIALVIMIHSVGLATIAALVVIILTVILNTPLAKLQHKHQRKLINAQDEKLEACSEALVNMKVLKLYAWETRFKSTVESFRKVEYKWLSGLQFQKACSSFLFWSAPTLVSCATFAACYFLGIPLHARNVFTFIATLRLMQEPIRAIPNVTRAALHARLSFGRLVKFFAAPEVQIRTVRKINSLDSANHAILMKSANLSWEMSPSRPTLRNINLDVRPGEKVAICGEVGSGKSTLLAAILGELPYTDGTVEACGRIAYVSQTAWIQTGTIRENILFGSDMDDPRYQETLCRCSLVKDLELLPHGDMTEIGERGITLSGGQKQRLQLARALYQESDLYLLDDPFSAVDAHTATSLFHDYVMEALSGKTVLLVTHQVDFLPGFDRCLLMSEGEILHSGPYDELIASSHEFSDLVNTHKLTAAPETLPQVISKSEIQNYSAKQIQTPEILKTEPSKGGQLMKQEQTEAGGSWLKPYLIYLNQNNGFFYFSIVALALLAFVIGQILKNIWMASGLDNPRVSKSKLIGVYLVIGFCLILFLFIRSIAVVTLGLESSKALFDKLLNSLFRAPMSFYDSTPLGRILSRISSDLRTVDIDLPLSFQKAFVATAMAYATLGVLAVVTWQIFFVAVPAVYMAIQLQNYYFKTGKALRRLSGTTKSLVANHLTESEAGAMTIRAFQEEDRFFDKSLDLIDTHASPLFHSFVTKEWLIQRIETLCATVLSAAALFMVFLPRGTLSSGFIGMALSYGLILNARMVNLIQNQCTLSKRIVSVERLYQYMNIPSEAPEVIADNRPPENWPSIGKVEICDLQIRYRPDTPLVLRGISCTFEGGEKIGIVGRTGSGKSTLLGALFRLVEPAGGKIIVDGVDICSIGLHDLRSQFGIIPQDPTLFNGTVRFNLDPLCQHNDQELWEVLEKCQLKETVQEKNQGLDALVVEDGSNWSMGQRQLFCLGRALLRKSKVLALDEATASIDNATDMILQKTIRTEFSDSTVITVAHRIPTVMDCTKVLVISDGKLMEYGEPTMLIQTEGSLFGQLVNEYWSHFQSADGQTN